MDDLLQAYNLLQVKGCNSVIDNILSEALILAFLNMSDFGQYDMVVIIVTLFYYNLYCSQFIHMFLMILIRYDKTWQHTL